MTEKEKEILSLISDLEIDCPDCKYVYDDNQYTCTTCWCEGGQGKINVLQYIKEHSSILNR